MLTRRSAAPSASVAINEPKEGKATMTRLGNLVMAALFATVMALAGPGSAAAQTKPEGEMRFAVYVTLAPAWLDPGEAQPGFVTPFWVLVALHDALVKPMPGSRMAASLAEAWSESEDKLEYEFILRKGLKFHNGDPFTAEDVKFSFERAKGAQLKSKVKEVVIVDPYKVRFVLHEPWPDFMAIFGTFASGAGWIVPKNYVEKVGSEGFIKHPIGLGPYKFVSMKPGIELVMEANESYWRKVPSVKRIVFQSVPEATTRLAKLREGEVDVAYLLEGELGDSIRNDANLKLVFSGGIATNFLDFLDMWDPKSPWADQRVRKAASLAIDRNALSDADTLGASKPNGNVVLKSMEYALPIEADSYDPERAKKLLAEAGYPNGFDAGELYPIPPYFSTGEAIVSYLGAVGIRTKLRTMERAAFYAALGAKKLKGVCFCSTAIYGNAATRISEIVPSTGSYAYGGWPDIDELYKKQLTETDPKKRETMLHELQKTLHERTRFAPIWDYFWPSGLGPRVEEASLMKIDPFPWSAPLEDVRLKRP
jgi:peptide/nickel transport system substrate-binding protein